MDLVLHRSERGIDVGVCCIEASPPLPPTHDTPGVVVVVDCGGGVYERLVVEKMKKVVWNSCSCIAMPFVVSLL